MDILLVIFALQLAILFVCLAYSIEGRKMPSKLSMSVLTDLIGRIFSTQCSLNERETAIVETETLQVDSINENEKGVVYLDCGHLHDIQNDLPDEYGTLDLDDDFEKSNFNELSWGRRNNFVAKRLMAVLFYLSRSVKSLSWRNGRTGRLQQKTRHTSSGDFPTKCHNQITRAVPSRRNLLNLAQLRLQMNSCPFKSKTLLYKNESLPEGVALRLKTKLTKLNFTIYKQKKTRPMPVIFELVDEAF